jgi:uncharacterized damage-inducible protein DinB
MTIADLLLPEFDQEMATTRRVLERVPEDKFSWKPHDKSSAMGALASHVANLIKWTVDTMEKTEFDLARVTPEEMNQSAKNRKELLEWFGQPPTAPSSRSDADIRCADLEERRDGVLHDAALQLRHSFVLNHIVHHRALSACICG